MAYEYIGKWTVGEARQYTSVTVTKYDIYNFQISFGGMYPSIYNIGSVRNLDTHRIRITIKAYGVTLATIYALGGGALPISSAGPFEVTVEQEAINTAPSKPGAFTQPTGDLEIGDSKVFAVGASSDAEGNLSKYIWEASINGGAFAKVGESTVPSFTYVIPTATSLKMRVKAVDAGALESPYTESVAYTVAKPKYYYNKYTTKVTNTYSEPSWVVQDRDIYYWHDYWSSYTFDKATGQYANAGTSWYGKVIASGNIGYMVNGSTLNRIVATKNGKLHESEADRSTKSGATLNQSFSAGTLVQSGIVADDGAYPGNGRYSDGYWYVRGSRVNASIAPPAPFTVPEAGAILEPKQALTLTFGASTAPSISTYEVQYRYNENPWADVGTHTNGLTRAFTVTEDKSLKTVEFRVRAKNTSSVYSDYIYSDVYTVQHNKIPTITLYTDNNKTLYENDSFIIDGSALEPDIGDVLIVYYKLIGGVARGIETKLSDGTAIPYKETLTFKSGKLHRGDTAITETLKEGTPYTLEVWAEDNQGGKSAVETRTFFVVPNRPPVVSIDPITEASGLIDSDKVTIKGMSADPDGNDVRVQYRINEGTAVQIHSGPAGPFTFDVPLSKLKFGMNTIVVEAIDTHDFKVSRTIQIPRIANLTPLAKTTQRYKIYPPAGTAHGVLMWILRDLAQEVTVEISMTNGAEQEKFVPLTLDTTAPDGTGLTEDFFTFRNAMPAENIVIKLTWTGDKPIIKLTGALTQ
ncbi:hypothetical protein NCCP2222_01740 [Sporosarcina sp. NCCP-2222]|uniref:hypothetical protein n=1 Tax=Sporosarcina sp. NCCP-2222 TaxID=2935073 RepID=UPI002081886A|nr:hypothetical protein [Sporosarcina sp. NCCP-2222]GKV54227.1 hypothetical protein NCCP2222_01740 [Sporosarcina sp. NCCP-2222]